MADKQTTIVALDADEHVRDGTDGAFDGVASHLDAAIVEEQGQPGHPEDHQRIAIAARHRRLPQPFFS